MVAIVPWLKKSMIITLIKLQVTFQVLIFNFFGMIKEND